MINIKEKNISKTCYPSFLWLEFLQISNVLQFCTVGWWACLRPHWFRLLYVTNITLVAVIKLSPLRARHLCLLPQYVLQVQHFPDPLKLPIHIRHILFPGLNVVFSELVHCFIVHVGINFKHREMDILSHFFLLLFWKLPDNLAMHYFIPAIEAFLRSAEYRNGIDLKRDFSTILIEVVLVKLGEDKSVSDEFVFL